MNFVCTTSKNLPSSLYKSLSSYRSKIFIERLGWNLKNEPGCEQDHFDREDTVHLLACDDHGEVVGCGRLLPTTSSYLLEEVFPHLLNGMPVPRSEAVWELSRFAIGASAGTNGKSLRSRHLAERLLLRALQFCARRGVTQLLAVSTLAVERLMLRAGVDVQRLGPPSMIDGQPVLAFVIQVNESSIMSLSSFDAEDDSDNMTISSRRLSASRSFLSTFNEANSFMHSNEWDSKEWDSKEWAASCFSRQLSPEVEKEAV
jgi:acyl homoserine lactone synthase